MPENNPSWVILKFGGSSVSHRRLVAQHRRGKLRERLAAGLRPVVVHSALSGVTDRLEALLPAALAGEHAPVLAAIETLHRDLAQALSVAPGGPSLAHVHSASCRGFAVTLAGGAQLSDGVRARVVAMGELLATTLGAQFLNSQRIAATWVDARQVLRSRRRDNATPRAEFLSATCDFSPDAELQSRWRAVQGAIVTQGFIAGNQDGDTVLLGRGGSDTSGAYFAAKLAALRLEIWTDVPGMFQCESARCAGCAVAACAALRRGAGNRQQMGPRCCIRVV